MGQAMVAQLPGPANLAIRNRVFNNPEVRTKDLELDDTLVETTRRGSDALLVKLGLDYESIWLSHAKNTKRELQVSADQVFGFDGFGKLDEDK